ncbi:MAG: hypothetical protein KAI47_12225, partial [Deltaproteobacteria bacterium]|nr:hypothetical protein [Deltaproteobacteria bacterium]
MSLNSVTLSFLVAFVAIFPPEAAASGSGVVSLSSKYARFLARSPHKIPMRGRAAELQKQIESWQVETRPKLTRINRHLVRALKAHHARLLPLSALPCASGRCKELEVSIGELLYLDWTSYYSVTLVARRPLDAAWEKRLTAELRALVRREHVLANIEALAPGKDSEFTLYDSV